jgi:hypothetical protein
MRPRRQTRQSNPKKKTEFEIVFPTRDAIKSVLPDFPDQLGLPPQQMPTPIDAPAKK